MMGTYSPTVARWEERAFARRPDVIGRNYSPQAVSLCLHHLVRHSSGHGEPPEESEALAEAGPDLDDPTGRLRAARVGAEVERYWRVVHDIAPLSALPEHRAVWEDGILRRLTCGPSYHRHRAGGDIIPQALIDKYGIEAFLPPAPRQTPAQTVESMFIDVARSYATAIRRAMLDYDLLGPAPVAQHHGLSIALLQSAREPQRPPLSREACGIAGTSVALAGAALSRRLIVTEPVVAQLMSLWFAPSHVVASATGGGGGDAYANVPIASFTGSSLYVSLPLPLEELSSLVDAQVRRGWRR